VSNNKVSKLAAPPPPEGLIGFFGHTLIPDPDQSMSDRKMIEYQFEILRKMEGARYVIQYFSFMDGTPTNLGVMTEAELLGPDVKLYANADLWNEGYAKDCYRRDRSRTR
jgi:hypothetical protein